ncbi:MAG: DUF433 domain-containing protein [Candidatus Eisenbacteria bacterium]|uniref:DUF433 domain-containing protein n=1 Tax=Eiseniibacteriota bacterium TaxID=2212470 RepID=A0A948RY98_UNCEI|nr:DUF433 domain-containing protein [Candidatus Eisenbacteria bacterium]MBU1949381.1 DUF433 domain-containing protein [Candidatus Eisenbacteria bacterium]MBU2690454.1 DUF433 domain-containing protein [Candidatus Eisenbacteria bacterium]
MANQKKQKELSAGQMPAYGIAEAARYLRLAPATLRSWALGRHYHRGQGVAFFSPLLTLPQEDASLLSFENLIEAHILWALRVKHSVPFQAVRTAIDYAESELGLERLLLSPDLLTTQRALFLERFGQLINLSLSGQLAMKKLLESRLSRIEWGDFNLPLRLFPITGQLEADAQKAIVIDPKVGFGRPILSGAGISTAIITARFDAGEQLDDIAKDYDISEKMVEAAIMYEKAA